MKVECVMCKRYNKDVFQFDKIENEHEFSFCPSQKLIQVPKRPFLAIQNIIFEKQKIP